MRRLLLRFAAVEFIDPTSFALPVVVLTGLNHFVAIADLDGDGKPDLVAAVGNNASVFVRRNLSSVGSISFAEPVGVNVYGPRGAIADFDGDGKLDLVAVDYEILKVYRNTMQSVRLIHHHLPCRLFIPLPHVILSKD